MLCFALSVDLILIFFILAKQMNVKFRQDDRDGGACFVALRGYEVETKSRTKVLMSVKVISIKTLSQRMFLILDSAGDLHLLCLSNSVMGANITGHMRQLPQTMRAQSLAILPDVSMSMHLLLLFYFIFKSCFRFFYLIC